MSFSKGRWASPLKGRKLGFTLLEVLIASSLLSVMIFMVWLFVPRALALEKQLELRDYAETLARNRAIELREQPVAGAFEAVGPNGVKFLGSSQIQPVGGSEETLREGTVQVHWDHLGQQQTVTSKTRWVGAGFP